MNSLVYSFESINSDTISSDIIDSFKGYVDKFEKTHRYLDSVNKQEGNSKVVDSLFKVTGTQSQKIVSASKNIINTPNRRLIAQDVDLIADSELPYFLTMQSVISEYQKSADQNLHSLLQTIYILAFIAILILMGEFLFILVPAQKQLFKQNDKLLEVNSDLAESEAKVKEHLLELTSIKIDLEKKDAYNKVFIEQSPTAIAMLDNDMRYIAVSQRWIADYKMENEEIIGRSHYNMFPEIGQEWKETHQKCLNGAIDTCDEAPFIRGDGTVQWISWDIRPWYSSEGKIGGLLIHTEDITHLKEKEDEKLRIEKILEKSNEVSRLGTWDIDLVKNTIFWSKMVFEIHEAPEGFQPDLETAIQFFKEGNSRGTIEKAVEEAIENGTPYDVEVELVTFEGNIVWTRAIGQVEIVDGKCVRIFGVFQDINEKKLSQIALREAHTELKAIFDSNAIAIVATNTDGIISKFNPGAEVLTGYSADEMIGLQRPILYHLRDELNAFKEDIAKQYGKSLTGFSAQEELAKHNAYDTREWHYLRKDGAVIPVQLTLTSIKDDKGKLIGYLGVSTDVSEKRMAQDELLRKNYLLNFAEEITSMGNWQWNVATGEIESSNNLYNIFNLDKDADNLNFDTYFNLVHPDDKDFVKEHINKIIEEKSFHEFTHRIITDDGVLKTIQVLGEVITKTNGEIVRINGTSQDITAAKAAEAELNKAHMQLKAIFNSGPIAIVSTDNNGILNHFNSGAELLLGYSASEMIGLKEPEIYHLEEELDQFRIDIAEKYGLDPEGCDPYLELAKRNEYDTREWTYKRKDGSTFPVELTLTAIKNEQDDKIGFLGVAFDITQRSVAKNELIRKNQLLNFAEEITLLGNWQWDTVADKVVWSNNLYNIFGLDKEVEDLSFDTYFSFVHPEDKDIVTNYFDQTRVEKKLKRFTHRIIAGNGEIKIIQLLGEVITDVFGNIIEMIGTCQDVTAAYIAKRELFDANTQLKAIFNSGPLAIVSVDNEGVINHFNHGAEILLGYSASEMIGKKKPDIYHLEEELLEFKKDIAKKYNKDLDGFSPYLELSKQNAHDTREWTYKRKNGSTFPVELTLTAIKNNDGEKIGFLAVANDISDRKMAQNELLRKNQILNFAEEITMMGNWQADIINDTVKWSANLYRIFQLDENTKTTLETYLSYTHPEDKERVAEHMRKTVEDKRFTDIVHRIQLADGTVKIVQLLAQVTTNDFGDVAEIIGTCQDVTAQRMAENKFRGLLESAPDAMVIVNAEGNIQLINKQAEKLFGYTAEELFNRSVEILIPKQFSEEHVSHRDGFFTNPRVRTMGVGNGEELFAINKSGVEIPIQISLSPLQTEEGLLISAAIRDITIQKTAQTKIIKAKNDLEVLAQKLIIQNSQLADFAQITSHNLRAPVSNLNSLLGFYVESDDPEEKDVLFQKFETVINHLTLTLNTLVEALKIRSDNSREKEDILFEDVLKTTTDILSGEILKTNAIIKADFSKLPLINYDKIYLESIFLNLIGNAIKYKSKDRDPEISIRSERDNEKIKLTISDNGLGINLDRHGNKIFGLNKVFHRHPDAKGVGLYMTKTQIEAMGGAINVSSKVNEGTTFTIIF
ncbi:PAS domain S-box protein [Winogradskyella psychrotolerans]|uniref:PAS domain-containing sensor histidine kinase n=1 Tax=Winogradskyella psychrotolerans TaxID=1344585 RepID=UPI001C074231|nr:PAS domain S-box protein [Winogradskyella psychrotolerans]MBU2920254.1 PAS domain S-box protein [Winogradskyella psychrotolerans]